MRAVLEDMSVGEGRAMLRAHFPEPRPDLVLVDGGGTLFREPGGFAVRRSGPNWPVIALIIGAHAALLLALITLDVIPILTAPKPKPTEPKKPKPVATSPVGGDWRIQLGAFSQRGSAEAMYQRVSGKAALAGRRPSYVVAGNVIRLQVGPFISRAAAQGACGSLGVACFPVPAR